MHHIIASVSKERFGTKQNLESIDSIKEKYLSVKS